MSNSDKISKLTPFEKMVKTELFMGYVTSKNTTEKSFNLKCRSNDEITVYVTETTEISPLVNFDKLDTDRIPPIDRTRDSIDGILQKYATEGTLLFVRGNYIENNGNNHFDARNIFITQTNSFGKYAFEDANWWVSQISSMADSWLENLFNDSDTYDFTKYRTYLDISGLPSSLKEQKDVQECATLSRLIYGLSSAYLLTGCQRYLDAAKAGVNYQREHFRILGSDSDYCFWASAKENRNKIIPSQAGDDKDSIPCYEQIYALAGLAQYYRITQEWEVLEDIEATMTLFEKYYYDAEYGGYFSHIDPITFSSNSDYLNEKDNKLKKNWNSIGDHIPAYLINLILTLEPLSNCELHEKRVHLERIIKKSKEMLFTLTDIIIEKFPDANEDIPFVNERFYQDWTPDQNWGWQKNRAIIGHNLKIAWNLTRIANYMQTQDDPSIKAKAEKAIELADKLAVKMSKLGIDQIRGGVFDACERIPKNGQFIDFTWGCTKDFWQQEQGILAFLILYGYFEKEDYKKLARESCAFWNLFFLDRDRKNVFFRVNETGLPIVEGVYANKGSHSISGYHVFELNYLAHIYTYTYITKKPFSLYFKPEAGLKYINVLPDFINTEKLSIEFAKINGVVIAKEKIKGFQIELQDSTSALEVYVQFQPK